MDKLEALQLAKSSDTSKEVLLKIMKTFKLTNFLMVRRSDKIEELLDNLTEEQLEVLEVVINHPKLSSYLQDPYIDELPIVKLPVPFANDRKAKLGLFLSRETLANILANCESKISYDPKEFSAAEEIEKLLELEKFNFKKSE